MCSILYPKPIGFKFYQDSIKFILMLGVLAVVGMTYTIVLLINNKVTTCTPPPPPPELISGRQEYGCESFCDIDVKKLGQNTSLQVKIKSIVDLILVSSVNISRSHGFEVRGIDKQVLVTQY